MAGRQHLGAELARGVEQVAELDRLVALDAGHRRLAGDIAFGEAVDHRFLEAALVVEHVMRDADALGDRARVVDVLAGAAGALAVRRRAMVVKLQRDADDVVALGLEQRRRDRGIDAARHGDDDARVVRPALDIEPVEHGHTISAAQRRRHGRRFSAPPAPVSSSGRQNLPPSPRQQAPTTVAEGDAQPFSALLDAAAPALPPPPAARPAPTGQPAGVSTQVQGVVSAVDVSQTPPQLIVGGQKVPIAQVQSTRSNRSAADYPRTIPRRRPARAGKTPVIRGSA